MILLGSACICVSAVSLQIIDVLQCIWLQGIRKPSGHNRKQGFWLSWYNICFFPLWACYCCFKVVLHVPKAKCREFVSDWCLFSSSHVLQRLAAQRISFFCASREQSLALWCCHYPDSWLDCHAYVSMILFCSCCTVIPDRATIIRKALGTARPGLSRGTCGIQGMYSLSCLHQPLWMLPLAFRFSS